MNSKTRYKERRNIEKLSPPLTNLQETQELRYFQRIVTQNLEIKDLKIKLGQAQSYIAELEDAEKAKTRYEIKREAEFDRLRKQISALLNEKGKLKDELGKAENKIKNAEARAVKIQHQLNSFTKPVNEDELGHNNSKGRSKANSNGEVS